MPSKSSTSVPKSRVSYPLTALHKKVCTNLCYCLLSPDLRNMRHELNAFGLCLIINIYIYIPATISWTVLLTSPEGLFHISHLNLVLSPVLMFLITFNFNSSFVRWRNWRMFLQIMTVVKNHCFKFTIYQNTVGNGCNFIMWISVVPHQVGITTFVKVAWIRRFLGEFHIHIH